MLASDCVQQASGEKRLDKLSFEEARALILSRMPIMEAEPVDILGCLGRVCAEDLSAPLNLPSFDNSAMDGYAVRAADCLPSSSLRVTGFVPAGENPAHALEAGCAIRIMTGAPIPQGCDAVVPLEETREEGDRVWIDSKVETGKFIRCAGKDIPRGETILSRGTLIGPTEISMLASFGMRFLEVYRQPRIAVLSTGDELVEAGTALEPGKVFDSNSQALAAAVREAGATPLILGIARDNRDSLRQKISEGLHADALITAAGVSVGDRDLVREVLSELGVTPVLWKVAMKPGKSTAFGVKDGRPIFSLPGNPVSSMVTFEELVRPAILKMMGRERVMKPLLTAILQEDMQTLKSMTFFARVNLKIEDGKILAWSAGHQDTGLLRTMLNAQGIAVLPPGGNKLHAGEEIKVHILSNHLGML